MGNKTKMWKRWLSLLLAVYMTLSNVPFDALAQGGWETPDIPAVSYIEMSLRYDDRYDVTGKTVEIVDAGTPTSYQVGYGVEENAVLDTAVVTLEGDYLVATGIGTAKVRIDGTLYEVTVTAAPISLLLLAGQSNMQGSEGDANQSIVCPDGMVYATYGDRYTMTIDNATDYAVSALAGQYSSINVNGTTDRVDSYPIYALNEAGPGKPGPDSGFAYEWVQQTGEKVWIVNAAHGGTNINVWQPGKTEYEECQALFTACMETMRKEIAAGHFTLSHMAYFWCQGCANYSNTAEWYMQKYLTMHESFKSELSFDHDSDPATADKTFEFGGIIPVRAGHEYYTSYRQGTYTDTTTAAYHESFKDLRFTGPRVAQYWMINNPELSDIWGVCNIGEDWVWMPDGTNGVTDYFQSHYENGTVDYTTQVAQSASWYTPTTPKAVHDSIHYNQIGYNEVGRESVRNALILLGEKEAPEAEVSVEFLTWDGYTQAEEIKAWTSGNSGSLVVPVVSPLWKAKEITYTVTDGLSYCYYDLLAETTQTEGGLTASTGETVSVVKQEPGAYFAEYLSQLPEVVCSGLNLWTLLEHDKEFYSPSSGWNVHSSGTVYSVTIPVQPGDKIFATSFGKGGENGHASSNGIRCTFFGEYEVVKTLAPADTYKEFSANGGYLVVPEGAVAVNVPMWTNDDTNELYILNLPHDRTEGLCGICGKDSHVHSWGDWETVSLPTAEAMGIEQRSCTCGETETQEVEGVWQKYTLADHMQTMPDAYCAGTNLWTALEHESVYFASGTSWAAHSSGKVYSVTIPVAPGDKIFATAFGKAGENGHTSYNGIRCTFFGAYDVVKTLAPSEVYPEFTANGGYLVAPEGAIAVNVPMWNNSDDNELYILNAEHAYGEWMVKDDDTRTRICDLCGTADEISRLTLPGYYTGLAYVENNPSGIYAGTRNVAEVLGLESGTFTNGEVTVTIDGTNITVSGTPSNNLYFDLQTGEFGTPDYKRDVGYCLPDGDYRFGINGAGTQAPTVCIRYPDGSGNLMTASQNSGVHTVTDVSGADFGVPYLYFPQNTAYDYSGNLVLAMGNNTFYDTQISQVEMINGTGEFTVSGYLWTMDKTVAVFGYSVSTEDKENQLVHTPGNKEYIQIYLPQENGYLQIRMNLENRTSTNAYGWRLDMMYACDNNYNELFPITQAGEYEAAIMLKGRSDFMGMGAHGSERMTAMVVYVDGEEVALDQLTALTHWEEIKMVRYSDFYDPADESTVVAHHIVEYHFDYTGLTVDQEVEWLVDETCEISYMMMFPVRRSYENLQITDTYFDDYDSNTYDVSQAGFKTYPANWTAGATKLTLYSEKSGVTASMESLATSELTGTGYKSCSNSSSYNKLYFTICGGGGTEHTVKAGDVWTTSTRYEVVIEKGTDVDNSCAFGHQYTSEVTKATCVANGYTTHTCTLCGDSYVDSYVDATGHSYQGITCTLCGAYSWDTDGDGVLEILAIGNSFSVDALEYAYQIANDLGVEEIAIGNLYIGGCSLETHAANAAGDLAEYTYYYNDNGTWTSAKNYKISTALEERSWDYVSLQQASSYSGVESTYNEDLTDLIAYVQARSDAKLVWHMTWAYQQNSTHSAFPTYGSDQMTMYNAIVSAVQNKIVTNGNFDLIVPNGTAVQNSRTSVLGDTTTRDGYHMSKDYGRYLTGLMFIKTLTGLPVDGITYTPSGVDAEEVAVAIESVNNAYANPFAVTQSVYVEEEPEIPDEGYILLQSELYKGAFWYPTNADRYNELVYDMSNSHQYYATIRFTRETLPVGSILILADGWQYRPDGWIADELQTGTREPVTTKSYVKITEEWWGDYTIRAFNISKVGLPSLTNVTEEEVRTAFQIYVSEASHSHEYKNGICTLCGMEHPNAANFEGKVISILSASTSTFAGWIPEADGFNLAHRARYPQDDLFTDVESTWWHQLISVLDAKLGINDSWAGSQVLNTQDTNSGDLGPDAAMASLTRIQNLGANGSPDVILFFGGGNDMGRGVTLGSFDPATAPTEVDLTATKWNSFADAYVAAILRLKHFYPDARIVAMTSYPMPSYVTQTKLDTYGPVIQAICAYYGVEYLSLEDCGVTFDMLPDNIHPNAEGMDYITQVVLDYLLEQDSMTPGENVVYSVKHDLTNAQASKHYYKGISAGKAFAETLSGDDLTVTVTMGGTDITASAYTDGKINIPAATGDIVVTAKGVFDADGHLQQLPEQICAGTNLWTALEPENIYYTVDGWGNTSAGNSWSITFPVKEGDKVWATSLGAYPENGSSANGVRVTWFDENGVLATLDRNTVYKEFAANGYITAPEGAVALNLPMTNNQDHYAVYLISAEHDYESVVTEPTCTEKGYTTHTCTICGGSYVDGETEVTGHSYAYAVEKEPTLTEEGALTGTCGACGDVTSVALPKLDELVYTYAVTKEPTYTETGTATYTWKDETYGIFAFEVTLDKLEILYGDVNGDGEVTGKDRTILARYLAEWDGYTEEDIDLLAADVNQDGEVTGKDRTILARHLAEWIGYEELPYTG